MGTQKHKRPATDDRIAPEQGVTKDGQPLSYNRSACPELQPWIARIYVAKVEMPVGYRLHCGLFNDTACIRVQLSGNWEAETADGHMKHDKAALFFGPQTRRMPLSVEGSFVSLGISLRPGACNALNGPQVDKIVDRFISAERMVDPNRNVSDMFDPEATSEEWAKTLEDLVRIRVDRVNGKEPDPVSHRFEQISFTDPTTTIAECAEICGVERRTLERIVKRDFGLSPKQVLRRARALDMASHLRGVADGEEANELALRFYDESHLIREFTDLYGMSPRQFVDSPQPIMTLTLESRQARRLEAIKRIAPGEPPPWKPRKAKP